MRYAAEDLKKIMFYFAVIFVPTLCHAEGMKIQFPSNLYKDKFASVIS